MFIAAAVLAIAVGAPAPDSPPSYRPPSTHKPAPAPYKPAPAPYKPAPAPYKPHLDPKYKEEPRPYAFDYAVNDHYTGTNFAQNEKSDGHNAEGSYTVALPDGRIQTVKYVADHYDGFNAEVSYKGEARHPEYKPAPAPYKPSPAPYKPAPVPYKPSPAPYKPAPAPYKPAPVSYKPALLPYKPVPVYTPVPKY